MDLFGEKILEFLRWLNNFIRKLESVVGNLVATVAPWLAPVIPANMTYTNLQEYLHFSQNIALSGAILVEFLGFATLNTSLEFWFWNRRYSKSEKKQMPFWLAIGSFVVYLLVIVVTNVLLDATTLFNNAQALRVIEITARLLLTILTVPAGMTIAIRRLHTAELDKLDDKRKGSNNLPKTYRKNSGNLPETYRKVDWRNITREEQEWCVGKTKKQIVSKFGISPRSAKNWMDYAEELVWEEE